MKILQGHTTICTDPREKHGHFDFFFQIILSPYTIPTMNTTMNNLHASEDSRSVEEISTSGQTHGNVSIASESGFNSSTADDYNQKKRVDSSNQNQDVAMREQKALNRSKLFVAFFLLIAACATAAATYRFVEQQEQKDFENQVSD